MTNEDTVYLLRKFLSGLDRVILLLQMRPKLQRIYPQANEFHSSKSDFYRRCCLSIAQSPLACTTLSDEFLLFDTGGGGKIPTLINFSPLTPCSGSTSPVSISVEANFSRAR